MPLDFTGQGTEENPICCGDCIDTPAKTFISLVEIDDPTNDKQRILVKQYIDTITQQPCFFYLDDETLSNPIKIEDIMNLTSIGKASIESPITITEIPYQSDGLVICADGSTQDVVALIQASVDAFILELTTAGYPIPAGAVLGLSKVSLQQFTDKRPVNCDIGANAGTKVTVLGETPIDVVGLGNTSVLVVNGGVKLYGRPLFDNGDCKGCSSDTQLLVSGDVTTTGVVGTAYIVDFCIACFAPIPV